VYLNHSNLFFFVTLKQKFIIRHRPKNDETTLFEVYNFHIFIRFSIPYLFQQNRSGDGKFNPKQTRNAEKFLIIWSPWLLHGNHNRYFAVLHETIQETETLFEGYLGNNPGDQKHKLPWLKVCFMVTKGETYCDTRNNPRERNIFYSHRFLI